MDDFDENSEMESIEERAIMREESLCVDFLTTNKMYDMHVEMLSNLPRLVSLTLTTAEQPLHKVGMDNSRNVQNQIGLLACRAFLQICYQKSQLRHEIAPITTLFLEGLTESCLYLPTTEIQQACLGMRHIEKIFLSFHKYDRRGERGPLLIKKYPIAGRLIRSAPKLSLMSLGWPWVRHDVFATHRPFLDFDSILLKKSALPSSNLTMMIWPHLYFVLFEGISFKFASLSAFLQAHKPFLKSLSLMACVIEYEAGVDESHDKPWQNLFVQAEVAMPKGKLMEDGQLKALSWGVTGHSHLSRAETKIWREWLMGNVQDPPQSFDDSNESSWCSVCQRTGIPYFGMLQTYGSDLEDDEDDYEDEEDEYGDEDGDEEQDDEDNEIYHESIDLLEQDRLRLREFLVHGNGNEWVSTSDSENSRR